MLQNNAPIRLWFKFWNSSRATLYFSFHWFRFSREWTVTDSIQLSLIFFNTWKIKSVTRWIPNYRIVHQYIFRYIFFGVPRQMTSQRNLNEPEFFNKRKIITHMGGNRVFNRHIDVVYKLSWWKIRDVGNDFGYL